MPENPVFEFNSWTKFSYQTHMYLYDWLKNETVKINTYRSEMSAE